MLQNVLSCAFDGGAIHDPSCLMVMIAMQDPYCLRCPQPQVVSCLPRSVRHAHPVLLLREANAVWTLWCSIIRRWDAFPVARFHAEPVRWWRTRWRWRLPKSGAITGVVSLVDVD
jgi:hypothetical protein